MRPHDPRVDMAAALSGGAPGLVRDTLDSTAVVVVLDPDDGPAAVLAAAALVSMSSRVVGHVAVRPVALPQPNPWRVRSLPAVAAASRLEPPRPGGSTTRRIMVRIGGRARDRADVYLGGDDWTAAVSRTDPLPLGPCRLGGPGLQVAAALAFGEVLKDLLAPLGMRCVPIAGQLTWNLVDGTLAPAPTDLPDRPSRPARVALLGSGSVGSSAAAVLAGSGLAGEVDIVDPDRFDPSRNAYRCPGVPAAEHGWKADWSAGVLREAGWSVRADRRGIAEWSMARPEPGYRGMALVSVDNVDARRDAADLMAQTTISAGVAGAALHVQRHQPDDDYACPYCELVDAGRWREQTEVYARLGLTVGRLQALLGGAALTAEDVATAIWTGAVDARAVHELPGRQLVDLIARHYATVAVRAGEQAGPRPVSAPHVPWLAGTLLAAEVVKAAVGIPALDRRVELDLTGIPLGGWRRPVRDPSGRCPCTRPSRRELARSLYGP